MRLELTPFQVHSLALWPVELRPSSKRPRQESNLRLRLCRPLPDHSATGSTSFAAFSARRAGIEPAASGFGDQRPTIGADGASGKSASGRTRTSGGPLGRQGYSLLQSPLCHRRETTVSVEGFEPSTPCARGTCAAKLRYTLKHSRRESNPRSPDESRSSCL